MAVVPRLEEGALCCTVGTVVIVNSTFVSNSAFGGAGGAGSEGSPISTSQYIAGGPGGNGSSGANGLGGGICVLGGALFMTNISCAGNLAFGGAAGAGGPGGPNSREPYTGPVGASGNPGMAQGDSLVDSGGALLILNSILDCAAGGTNGYGNIVDAGYNINSDATGFLTNSTSLNDSNPLLGTLGNYGGPTETIPLLAGSPAIDAGDPNSFPPADQRGYARPFGPGPDIGAFEYTPGQITGNVFGLWPPDQATIIARLVIHFDDKRGQDLP